MTNQTDAWVDVAREGSVAIVTLIFDTVRPVLCHASGQALVRVLHELNTDPACRSIVLTGRGADFCPGGDFSRALQANGTVDAIAVRGQLRTATTIFRDIRRGAKPVLVAVEGAARGAGLALAAAGDYVVAASDASFSCDAVAQGLLPDAGLLWALPEKLGDAKARELIMLGKTLPASEAHRLGLVSELVEPRQSLGQALAVAKRFDSLPAVSVALLKAAMFNGALSMEDSCRMELDLNPLVRQAVDHLEAVAGFLEKRRPNFVGN